MSLPDNFAEAPEVKALVEAAVTDAIAALKAKNKELAGQLAKANAAWKDLDPEDVRESLAELDELRKAKTPDVEELVAKKAGKLQKQIETLSAERDRWKGQAQTGILERSLTTALSTVGEVQSGAMDFVMSRAREAFSVDDEGNLVGDLAPEDWARSFHKANAFVFKAAAASGGSGAPGGASGSGAQGGQVVLTLDEMRNPSAYRAKRQQALQQGKPLAVEGESGSVAVLAP